MGIKYIEERRGSDELKVVLTVPHAISDKPDKEHYRDMLAPAFAKQLHDKIRGSVLIMGDEKREIVDLNRKEGRPTHFRDRIRRELKNGDILVDIHSFDENSKTRTAYDIVLLYHPNHGDLSFHKHLLDKLKECGFRASIFWNEYGCDIINEFPNNISVLIEVNEQTNNIRELAKTVASAISSYKLDNPDNDIIAYHGSNSKISSFKSGSYFTPYKKEALVYATPSFFNQVVRGRSSDEIYLYKVKLKDAKISCIDWNNEVDDVIMEKSEKYNDLDDAIEDGIRTARENDLNFIRFLHPTYDGNMADVYVNANDDVVEILEVHNYRKNRDTETEGSTMEDEQCKRIVYDWESPGRVKEITVPHHDYAWSGKTPMTGVYRCVHCGKIARNNPLNRWQVYESGADPSLKHPYNQIAHQYDSSNLSMNAIDVKKSSFDFINKLYEDSVVTIKMDGEFNVCVYNFLGSPHSDARGKKGTAPVGLKCVFANLNTLKWGFPVLNEIEDILHRSSKYNIDEVVFAGELLVHGKDGELLRGGKARAFVGHEDDTHYYIFDIISLNGTRVRGDYVSRLKLVEEIIGKDGGDRVHIVYWEDGGPDVAKRIWEDTVVPLGHEGLVVRSAAGGSITKVKIVHPIDLVVVGWKYGSGKISGLMGALLLSLRDELGVYRFNASVGTGFSHADRKWWSDEMKKIETGETKNVSGDTFRLVDPTKSPIIEVECNEFHPQMYDAYEFDGKWNYVGTRFTHIIQKPRMKRIRTDKTNNTKSLRLEQIPDYKPDNVFEVNITDQEIEEHNKIVQELLNNAADLKLKKKEYTRKKKEFQEMIGTKPLTYKDVGEVLSPDFVKRAFIPPKKKGGEWQPWFVKEEPVEGEVKVEFPGIPEIKADIPRVGAPKKFSPLKFEDEQISGLVPPSKAPTGGGIPPPPPVKKRVVTGEKNKRGKDIVVTYYPEPVPGIPISKLGMTCNCDDFFLNDTCKHVKDAKIIKKVKGG